MTVLLIEETIMSELRKAIRRVVQLQPRVPMPPVNTDTACMASMLATRSAEEAECGRVTAERIALVFGAFKFIDEFQSASLRADGWVLEDLLQAAGIPHDQAALLMHHYMVRRNPMMTGFPGIDDAP